MAGIKYRIRKWVSRNPNGGTLYYPQYRRYWYSYWQEGNAYKHNSDAARVIDTWISFGIPEESSYIKYP